MSEPLLHLTFGFEASRLQEPNVRCATPVWNTIRAFADCSSISARIF